MRGLLQTLALRLSSTTQQCGQLQSASGFDMSFDTTARVAPEKRERPRLPVVSLTCGRLGCAIGDAIES